MHPASRCTASAIQSFVLRLATQAFPVSERADEAVRRVADEHAHRANARIVVAAHLEGGHVGVRERRAARGGVRPSEVKKERDEQREERRVRDFRVGVDDPRGGGFRFARRDVSEKRDERRRGVRAPSGFVHSTASATHGLEREIGQVQKRARENETERMRGVGVGARVFREPVGEIGRDAVRAARTDAGEIRFATRRRHHRREPTTRDARDGEVRKFANGEIASRRGGDEEIDGEDRRERRRGDAERGEPEMRGAVTSKRVVACEMRKRTVHVDVVTRERGRRGGDDGHEQRFGDEIEQRVGDEREDARESRREARRESNRRDVGLEVRRALAIRRGGGVRGDSFVPTFSEPEAIPSPSPYVAFSAAARPRRAPPRGANQAPRQRRGSSALGSRELRRDERRRDERRGAVRGDVIPRRVELPREGSSDGRDRFAQPRRGVTPEREGR